MRRRTCPPPGALRAPASPSGARMARAGGGMEREASPRHKTSAVLVVAAVFGCVPSTVRADPVADFYRGRQINLILSADVGGGYASYANAFAPYFASHVPGRPQVVVQNMPGAGGIRAMTYFATVAPRDGTTVGLVHSGIPLGRAVGGAGAKCRTREV